MAKDTQIIVMIPGAFNEDLAKYMFLLEDKGISISKAELIIQLARRGYRAEVQNLEEGVHYDNS